MQTHFKLYTLIIDHDSNLLVEFEGPNMFRSNLRDFTSGYPPISTYTRGHQDDFKYLPPTLGKVDTAGHLH